MYAELEWAPCSVENDEIILFQTGELRMEQNCVAKNTESAYPSDIWASTHNPMYMYFCEARLCRFKLKTRSQVDHGPSGPKLLMAAEYV